MSPPGRPRPCDSPTPEPEHDLGLVRHRVHPLDQGPLRRRVEAEPVGVAEGAPEDGQVQGGLVVGGRVQHGRRRDLADGGHRRVVHVRIEGDDVGVRRRHRLDQLGRDGPVVLDPALRLLPASSGSAPAAADRRARRRARPDHAPTGDGAPARRSAWTCRAPARPPRCAGSARRSCGPRSPTRVVAAQVLGQLPGRRLGPAHDLRAVARGDEGHPLRAHGRPSTAPMASTSSLATPSPCQRGRPGPAGRRSAGAAARRRCRPGAGRPPRTTGRSTRGPARRRPPSR